MELVSQKFVLLSPFSLLLEHTTETNVTRPDFDWEYPGADDRGGNSDDGVNYTQLLQELKSAISAAGKDYIVTFTAPTSYWYLRHFDLANMVQYVDWVNLMSYDLHGVWDSSDPIGNQVLAHTNLTEIDQALDLVRWNGLIMMSSVRIDEATPAPPFPRWTLSHGDQSSYMNWAWH